VTEVGLFRELADRDRVALVTEGDLLPLISTSTIAVSLHPLSRVLFRGLGRRSLTLARTYGVAVTQMGSLRGFTDGDRVLAFVAEGNFLLTSPALALFGLADALAVVLSHTRGGFIHIVRAVAHPAGLRVGSRRLLDRLGRGGLPGLAYGRFASDGRLGGIPGGFWLGRGAARSGSLRIRRRGGLRGRVLRRRRHARVAAGPGHGHTGRRQQDEYQGRQDD
jgi:hypothetical protein